MQLRKPLLLLSFLLAAGIACAVFSPPPEPSPTPPPATPTSKPPTPTPTATPTEPTVTPTAPPTPPATETPASEVLVLPPAAGAGPCANVLYPMVLDNQWVYQITTADDEQQLGLTVSEVSEAQATLDALYLELGVTTQTTVACDQGAITSFPLVVLGVLIGDADGSLQMEYVSGVFAPAYQSLAESNWDLAWEGEYLATGTLQVNDEGETITARLEDSPVYMSWQTAGAGEAAFEAIEVPAGAFPRALKVNREVTFDVTLEFESEGGKETVAATIVFYNTLWYEPHLGLLRQQTDRANISFSGMTFPFVAETTAELLEFRAGE